MVLAERDLVVAALRTAPAWLQVVLALRMAPAWLQVVLVPWMEPAWLLNLYLDVQGLVLVVMALFLAEWDLDLDPVPCLGGEWIAAVAPSLINLDGRLVGWLMVAWYQSLSLREFERTSHSEKA